LGCILISQVTSSLGPGRPTSRETRHGIDYEVRNLEIVCPRVVCRSSARAPSKVLFLKITMNAMKTLVDSRKLPVLGILGRNALGSI